MKEVKKYIILGLGKSGRGVALWCTENNAFACIIDDAKESAKGFVEHENLPYEVLTSEEFIAASEKNAEKALCIISPGIPPSNKAFKRIQELHIPIISEVELALQVFHNLPPLIAVTGTNGKTTVVSLITHIINASGKKAKAVGNIGTPLIEAFNSKEPYPDVFVVELSSFQLGCTFTNAFSLGCLLNVTPNHLDWHSSIEEYRQAKEKLYFLTRPEGTFFLHESVSSSFISGKGAGSKVIVFGKSTLNQLWANEQHVVFCAEKAPLPQQLLEAPEHDRDNYLVAYGVTRTLGIGSEQIVEAFKTFKKAPHRIEVVLKKGNITYIDDSKSTNIASTEAAIASCGEPIVLIAGGVHKGSSYEPWKKFSKKLRAIIAIGESMERIVNDLGNTIPVHRAGSLLEAVQKASHIITSGTVLLSPGCSSFDMFHDYKDRGRQFREIVISLAS